MTFRGLSYKLCSCSTSAACASSARSPSRVPSPPPRRPSPSRSPPSRSRSPRSSARPARSSCSAARAACASPRRARRSCATPTPCSRRLAEAEAELEAIAGLRGGRLRMAAFESAGATLMPLAIADFRAKHPAIELSMTLGEPEDDRAAAQERRARPRARLRLALRAGGRHRAPLPARGPDAARAPARAPAREQAQPAPGRPRRRGVDRRPAGLRVQPADLRRLLGARATTRGSRSRPTTTPPCRASSPPASACR